MKKQLLFLITLLISLKSFSQTVKPILNEKELNEVVTVLTKSIDQYSSIKTTGNFFIYTGSVFLIGAGITTLSIYSESTIPLLGLGITFYTIGSIKHIAAPYKLRKVRYYFDGRSLVIPLNKK